MLSFEPMAYLRALCLLLPALLMGSLPAHAEMVLVVNARTTIDRMSQDEVINIFMGRSRRLPDGNFAVPIDQPEGSALKTIFYRRLVNKGLAEINAYWTRLVFSGKTSPPEVASSSREVTRMLVASPGAIAYLERSEVDSRMRIVFEFPP
jgi:ABC-type phosphate transport system substrate-binding protein